MENILFLTLLYDFYGDLLTSKQKDIFYMYYQDNLSLSEIGGIYGITRQAVSDIILRTEKKLLSFEDKLVLIDKFTNQNKIIAKITDLITEIENNINAKEVILCCVEKIKIELEEL